MTNNSIADKQTKLQITSFRDDILNWYDRHQRVLPWRASQGQEPNPYHVWLSEIMLQQTTVTAVIPYFEKFVDKWPTVKDLAAAKSDDIMTHWAGLGYYARARNLHKCANVIANDYDGQFPQNIKDLKALPGIGDYTSAAIRSIAFDKAATVVDSNVERVMARYFAIEKPLPDSKKVLKAAAGVLSKDQNHRPGDYAQALMDLGATICTPKSPKCMLCPVQKGCEGFKQGIQEALPKKKPKKINPKKHAFVYWVINEKGDVLLHKRPENMMLGHMTGLPTSDWVDIKAEPDAPDFINRIEILEQFVMHSFTHFDIKLFGRRGNLLNNNLPDDSYFWHPIKSLSDIGFPTLFKKFVKQMI